MVPEVTLAMFGQDVLISVTSFDICVYEALQKRLDEKKREVFLTGVTVTSLI